MSKFEDITGQKFDRLMAIERVKNINGRPAFLCKCDCGETKECKTYKLKDGTIKSCGCLQKEYLETQTKDITGQIFGKLTVIKRNGHLERGKNKDKITAYLCQCSCGETRTITGSDLRSGHTKSCGCGRAVDDPYTISAYKIYTVNYNDGDLTFEQFMELTQQNCYYCNATPTNNNNSFKTQGSAKSSQLNGGFQYNGLDRVDSNQGHDFYNLVPCCKICNKAKSNRPIEDFKNHIIKSYNYLISAKSTKKENLNIDKYLNLLNDEIDYNFLYNKIDVDYNRKLHPAISAAKKRFEQRYNDGDLTFEDFLQLTQYACEYCGDLPTNKYNKFIRIKSACEFSINDGTFIYNGLDRKNSNLKHDKSNLVTACKVCNWIKCNTPIDDYKNWIIKVYENLFKSS